MENRKNIHVTSCFDYLEPSFLFLLLQIFIFLLASLAQLDAWLACDQKVAGSIPAGSGNILSWRLIIKYSLRSDHEIFTMVIFFFHWFKEGSCQFLANECAQVLGKHFED